MDGVILKKSRKCAICKSDRKQMLFEQYFSTISEGTLLDGYKVVACLDCGFCFADDIPGQEDFDSYYKEMSKYEYQDRAGRESEYDLARFQKIISFLKPYLSSYKTRVMEVGCSTGRMLCLLKEAGYDNVFGIDPSPYCAEAAKRLYGIKVLTNTLSNVALSEHSCDFIIMAGVLEHICDLTTCLTKLRRVLSAEGQLFITIPDASRYVKGEDAPFQEFSIEHINFFGSSSLINLLSTHGFSPVQYQGDLLRTNYRTISPVIQAIFKRDENIRSFTSFKPDTQTQLALLAYIDESHRMEARLQRIIAEVGLNGQPIIVWGAGTHTLRLMARGCLSEVKIAAFVDSNSRYWGRKLNGVVIIPPFAIEPYPQYPILISSRAFQKEISKIIRDNLGLKNEVIILYDLEGSDHK